MFFLQKYELLILDRTKLDNFDFEVIFAQRHGCNKLRKDCFATNILDEEIEETFVFFTYLVMIR